MKSDEICDHYAEMGVKLTIRLLDDETVLIEGASDALTFLSKLLEAHVGEKEDGRQLTPNGPGQVFFTEKSTLGIYIHMLPCE